MDLFNLLKNKKQVVWGLVVSEDPELYRKLREACKKNFLQVSSKSASVTPSYFQKTVFDSFRFSSVFDAGAQKYKKWALNSDHT